MNPALSDCCAAPSATPLDPSATIPGKGFGVCSCCRLTAVYDMPHVPERRSAAGFLIGLGLTVALASGVAVMSGNPWLGSFGFLVTVILGILAYRQTP